MPIKERGSYDGDTAIKLYLREIGQVKLLTPQEEIELAARIKKGDKKAKATGGNVAAAKEIGKTIAQRAKEKGVKKVVFDRGGYLYHGRIKALADAAREAGLEF